MDKNDAIDIVKDGGYGFLATTEGSQPRVRPLMPYYTEDDELLISLFPNRRTIPQIQENPQIEMCFVDRKMSFCRIAGKAVLSDDAEKKQILWTNVPMLRQYYSGPEDENFKLIVIKVESIEAMGPNQEEPDKIAL
ncbi:pyridoxamine 5'-phosphate oxidase family protein [Candidatus Omnitrophota bacterium]